MQGGFIHRVECLKMVDIPQGHFRWAIHPARIKLINKGK